MDIFITVVALVILCFGFVVAFGAPYLPTLKPQIQTALDLLDLQPGQTLLEIGSGDGRVLLAAAERGWLVVGYELNPILVLFSLWHTRKYRGQIRVIWGNAFTKKWPVTDGIYIFGLDKLMPKLHKKVIHSIDKPLRIVSFTFQIPAKKPMKQKNGVYLYIYKPE
jgi:SAM-dependent methyltransferase